VGRRGSKRIRNRPGSELAVVTNWNTLAGPLREQPIDTRQRINQVVRGTSYSFREWSGRANGLRDFAQNWAKTAGRMSRLIGNDGNGIAGKCFGDTRQQDVARGWERQGNGWPVGGDDPRGGSAEP
jgi:hypothetical protein